MQSMDLSRPSVFQKKRSLSERIRSFGMGVLFALLAIVVISVLAYLATHENEGLSDVVSPPSQPFVVRGVSVP